MCGNDVQHAHFVFQVDDVRTLAQRLLGADVAFVSPLVVALPDGTQALMVRDPDGHAVELVKEAAKG